MKKHNGWTLSALALIAASGAVHADVELVGVTSTEPFDGQGDGNTADDIEITADGRIFVRGERSGSGNDRIYTITYKATDASGNFAFGSGTITVPHDHH